MLKENKGITLVALVITIIVLLILAGVSISLVVGDNGVLTQSQTASKNTTKSQIKEDVETSLAGIQTTFMAAWADNTSLTLYDRVDTADEIKAGMNISSATLELGTISGTDTKTCSITVSDKGVTATGTLTVTKTTVKVQWNAD